MGSVFLAHSLSGQTEQPLPRPERPPAASADAYLCHITCPGYVPPLRYYVPAPLPQKPVR